LEIKPLGTTLLFKHLVIKFTWALVFPIFLQVFTRSPCIPLQEYIDKNMINVVKTVPVIITMWLTELI